MPVNWCANPTPRTNSLVILESEELSPSGSSPGGRTTFYCFCTLGQIYLGNFSGVWSSSPEKFQWLQNTTENMVQRPRALRIPDLTILDVVTSSF